MHGVGVSRAVAEAVPPALVPVLATLTQLGDAWFLILVVVLGYWHGPGRVLRDRPAGVRLLAAALAGIATVTTLKVAIGHPRPPPPVTLVHADGYALPSGHATGSAAVYTALALLATRWTPRKRALLAAGLVALVAFTRVALGVHYLLDVLLGAGIGALVAVAVVAGTREHPAHGLWAATLVGLAGVVVSGGAVDPVAVTGVGAGAAGVWTLLERGEHGTDLEHPSLPLTVVGLGLVGGLVAPALALSLPVAVVAITSVGSGAVLVGVPAVQNFSR